MGRTACTEPQCLYKGALYLFRFVPLVSVFSELQCDARIMIVFIVDLFTLDFLNCAKLRWFHITGWGWFRDLLIVYNTWSEVCFLSEGFEIRGRQADRQGGFPLPQGRANYKFHRGSDKFMALVRSVDVPEPVIGLYCFVISHEIWYTAFNKQYLHRIVLKRKSWKIYGKKFKTFYGNILFMQSGKLQNGEKKLAQQEQYDHRISMITGLVWSKDRCRQGTSMTTGPVWSQDLYHQGLVWSQEHCDKGRIRDKDQYNQWSVWSQDQHDYMTGIIKGLAWLHDRYHQGTSMITGPVSSRDQCDHMTGIIKGPVRSQQQCDYRTGMITVPVFSQHRYDHRTQKSLYWRIN